MINAFYAKKMAALLVPNFVCVVLYAIGTMFYGFVYGIIFFGIGLLVSFLIGSIMLSNPFQKLLEGKGILVLDINSTGIIKPMVFSVQSPYIKGTVNKKYVEDVFDRDSVYQLAAPIYSQNPTTKDNKGMTITISEDEYNSSRFAMFHYPVLIYNSQIQSLVTKDFLSTTEKEVFAEHGVLYLNKKVEELTSAVRDFGRHVVESLKPKTNILNAWWFWAIVIFIIGIMGVLFIPPILEQLGGGSGGGGGVLSSLGNAITPRG